MRYLNVLSLCSALSSTVFCSGQTPQDSMKMAFDAIVQAMNGDGVEAKESYMFQHSLSVSSYKESLLHDAEVETQTFYFTTGSGVVGMGSQEQHEGKDVRAMVVYDMALGTMVSCSDVDTLHVGMKMRMPDLFKDKQPIVLAYAPGGSKRIIAGQEAQSYVATKGTETITVWIAPSTIGDLALVYDAWGKLNGDPEIKEGDFPNGLVLAAYWQRTDEKEAHEWFEVQQLSLNTPFTFSTKGYTFLQ
jgi:hypothetical protein